ncbi:MAG: 23S rRNA (guanosine(2251)-2'-O)-methyltransferase RlmB [Chitinophagales bacterium]|nr:23S rRNA (guanosine(2251)-2'-O)-methyltransferase RlmB [Chitinophagales bacterium]
MSYVFGRHPVIEALESEKEVDKVMISKFAKGEVIEKIKSLCHQKDVFYQIVPEEKIKREVKDANHQGVMALLSVVEAWELQELIDNVLVTEERPKLLLLDGVTDVGNMGALARTAHGMGFHGIIVPKRKSASIQGGAIKASAGALMHLPICKVNNLAVAAKDLKLNGFTLLGIHSYTEKNISEIETNQPIVIVLGAEDTGISPQVQKEIDTFYKIPIQNIDSYNVSVAGALVMYQIKLNEGL